MFNSSEVEACVFLTCIFDSFLCNSVIPGIQKIWIRTWGCSHNNSDGEYMAGQLAAYGYKITGNNSNKVT